MGFDFLWNTNDTSRFTPLNTIRTIFFVNANCFIDAKHTLIILTNLAFAKLEIRFVPLVL